MRINITQDEVTALSVTIGALKTLLGRNREPDEYMRLAEAFVDRLQRQLQSPVPKRPKRREAKR